MQLKEELTARGFLKQVTNEKVFDIYDQWEKTFYIGMDPTADSLHLGNFVGFMHAVQYMKRGNKLIFIIWGATGMIGDPGGKDSERNFLDAKTLARNVGAITKQVHNILKNLKQLSWHNLEVEVVNNLDFYKDLEYITFLREVGKYITVNQMMHKETVKRRLTQKDQSISYTEFSYMLMQAYDFYKLFTVKHCLLQIAWSDQWGNLVTWVELIRKKTDQEAYGITTDLILDASGKKFGKSAWNALWLDPQKNNPLVIYQYFMNTSDEDIERYFKLFTLLPFATIEKINQKHQEDQHLRYGQQELAYYLTMTIFGEQAAKDAKEITNLLFHSKDIVTQVKNMKIKTIRTLHQATGWSSTKEKTLRFLDACTLAWLTESKGETKKLMKQWVLFLYDRKITDLWYEIQKTDRIHNLLLLKKGKKKWRSIRREK